jgi:ABC-type antimicrobial peptide transport system permease subunit
MVLTIVVSSQVNNFQTAAEKSIFGTIEDQATLINLVKTVTFQQPGIGGQPGRQAFNSDNQFTSSDITKITQISNVVSASINAQVPIQRAVTTDLFSGANYNLQNVVEIDSNSASLFTQEDFSYKDGTVIPIILNASTFQEQYEDWGGKNEIEITFNRGSRPIGAPAPGANPINDLGTPIKTRTLEYDKNSLLGKTFTVTFGGLDPITDYSISQSSGVLKFTKLTQEEIDIKTAERKTALEKYWDYAKISTPITYTFKVAGIIESESDTKTYIPSDFADALLNKYVSNQLVARNSTTIPTDLLNSTYRGMTYDGTELSSGNAFMGIRGGTGGGGIMLPFGGNRALTGTSSTSSATYTVPGLVIELKNDGSQEVIGVHSDADVYKNAVKKGQSISVKIKGVYDRTQVVKELNAAGFSYQDVNILDVFNNLRNTLNTVSTSLTIAFIVLSIAVITFAMSKFVSESRKEIGIFRSIGMKKSDIVVLFTSQALLYTLVGYLIGGALGYGLNLASAGFMSSWFDSLVLQTVKETFNVVNTVDSSIFSTVAVQMVSYYSLALLVITFFISLIPALKASSISPVEAIKGE